MGLLQPVVGIDTGLTWEQNINANSGILDQHNHSAGSGVQINPSGIDINTDLAFNSNNATNLRSVRLLPQASPLSGASDLGCLYESGVDLWYNDGSGDQIQITSGGKVFATSSGISSGTNTASFAFNVLVVNANTNTPANIQGASILLGNNIVNSNYLTLSPPNAMATNYSLVLPALPASQSFLTIDTSGNIAAYAPIANGITASNIAAGTITTTQISPTAGILGSQLDAAAGIVGGQIASNINLAGTDVTANGQQIVTANTNTGTGTGLSIIRGTVNAAGSTIVGEGFSSSQISTGYYDVVFTGQFFSGQPPSVVASTYDTSGSTMASWCTVTLIDTAHFLVKTYNNVGGLANEAFSFIVVGPKF
jgi:hypothetical protein